METNDCFKKSPVHDKFKILELMDELQPDQMILAIDYIFNLVSPTTKDIENPNWIDAYDEEPSDDIHQVIAKSPNGVYHLTSWRPAYGIFSCMAKTDSIVGWKWRTLE